MTETQKLSYGRGETFLAILFVFWAAEIPCRIMYGDNHPSQGWLVGFHCVWVLCGVISMGIWRTQMEVHDHFVTLPRRPRPHS